MVVALWASVKGSFEVAQNDGLVIIDISESVEIITLNRPEVINALNQGLVEELSSAVAQVARQPEVRCLVLRGAGKGFCSGADLKERLVLNPAEMQEHRAKMVKLHEEMAALDVPVIAACHGGVVAGGMELALACDIRVATEGSRWGLTEVRNTGAFPGALGPVRLEKLIGSGGARKLVFTGELISGAEAYRLGMVDVLCPDSELHEASWALAKTIAENSGEGIAVAKRLMVRSHELPMNVAGLLSLALRAGFDGAAGEREAVRAWTEAR